jgi:CO/xanthine dehydrogenase FAD-binding subunit
VTYHRPESLDEALALLRGGGLSVIAGGTDWFPARGTATFGQALLDVTRIAGLRGIVRHGDGWRIGAATTWTDVVRADLPPAFDGLKAAAREVGSVQIQNAGTVAGNLVNASPAADGVPPLLTLEAEVRLTGPEGARALPLAEFLTGVRQTALRPGELVTALHIPDPGAGTRSVFAKLGARRYLVISIAMVAVLLRMDGPRIGEAKVAVGACSTVAQRLPALEAALRGCRPSEVAKVVRVEHLAPLSPIDDMRGSATYRLGAVVELLTDCIAEATG